MSHVVYILHSKKLGKFYIGQTEDLSKRIQQHLNPKEHTSYTSRAKDWKLYLEIPVVSRDAALKIEGFIKRMKSKKFIISLKNEPEKLQSIVSRLSND